MLLGLLGLLLASCGDSPVGGPAPPPTEPPQMQISSPEVVEEDLEESPEELEELHADEILPEPDAR